LDEYHPVRFSNVTWDRKTLFFAKHLRWPKVVGWHYQKFGEWYFGRTSIRSTFHRSVVAKVEDHFKGKTSKSFELTPELCRWLTCEFRHQVEVAGITFFATWKDKAYMRWLKTKKRVGRTWKHSAYTDYLDSVGEYCGLVGLSMKLGVQAIVLYVMIDIIYRWVV
jgi:hypothetical protein